MRGLCNPHEITGHRTETESRLGVIIEVSSPFWPITTLAISMTSGAVGLSPFAVALSPVRPAGFGKKKHIADRQGITSAKPVGIRQ